MRRAILLLLPLLASCSRCSGPAAPGPGPIAPPVSPFVPGDATETLRVTYLPGKDVLQFNVQRFDDCSALEVVYDGTNYGIMLPNADLYLPADKPGDRHQIQVTCLDDNGAPLNTEKLTQVRPDK